MGWPSPKLVLALGLTAVIALPVGVMAFLPQNPNVLSPCGAFAGMPSWLVPAGSTVLLGQWYAPGHGGSGQLNRLTMQSWANGTYVSYIQNEQQFAAYLANSTSLNISLQPNPPPQSYWTSGAVVNSTVQYNVTLALHSGGWFWWAWNPTAGEIRIAAAMEGC